MSEDSPAMDTAEKRRTLWIVLLLNVGLAIGFGITGALADSSALIANGLDNASDALVYVVSLLALTRSFAWKQGAARISGILLLAFAAGVVLDTIRLYLTSSQPIGPTMITMAIIGAVVNAVCLWLLKRLQEPDVNLRAATTFSFNDFISNGGIVLAGLAVLWTGKNWPDLVVGAAVAAIVIKGGLEILRDARVRRDDE